MRIERGHLTIWAAIIAIIIVLLIRDRAHANAEFAYVSRISTLEKTVATQQAELTITQRHVSIIEQRLARLAQPVTTTSSAAILAAPSVADRIKSTLEKAVAMPRLMPLMTEVPIIP